MITTKRGVKQGACFSLLLTLTGPIGRCQFIIEDLTTNDWSERIRIILTFSNYSIIELPHFPLIKKGPSSDQTQYKLNTNSIQIQYKLNGH